MNGGASAALPALLALLAAMMFGISNVAARRGLRHADPQAGSTLSIAVCTLIYLALSPAWMRAADWFSVGFWIFVLNGLFHPMLSMYMAYEANERAGATLSATLSATSPLFATALAIAFLGESLNAVIAAGTLLTVAGLVRLARPARGSLGRAIPPGPRGIIGAALLFATGAALIRALNQTLTAWGLGLMPNPPMAAFTSFAVAALGSTLMYRLRFSGWPLPMARAGALHFALAGACVAVAIVCMFAALGAGRVVTVSPIVASYPLFTLLTALVLREEQLRIPVLQGVLLVVAGVVLVSAGAAWGDSAG